MKNKLSLLLLFITPMILADYKDFVFIINSYNNVEFCERNINSALDQDYPTDHYRIILTCDCCTDQTYDIVTEIVNKHPKKQIVTLINNPTRKGAMRNFYEIIHQQCKPHEIMVTLDGDDFAADNNVLSYLNTVYANPNIWVTYGSYKYFPENCGYTPGARAYPAHIIKNGNFRKHDFVASHLRTYYAWLFQKIAVKDLQDKNGEFYSRCPDLAIMFPLLEMACERHKFIDRVLCVYNVSNPINENAVSIDLVNKTTTEIHRRPKYQRLPKGPDFLYKK